MDHQFQADLSSTICGKTIEVLVEVLPNFNKMYPQVKVLFSVVLSMNYYNRCIHI